MKIQPKILLIALISVCTLRTAMYDKITGPDELLLDSPYYRFNTQFRALVFKPSASNLHYAAQATTLPAQSPHWNVYDLQPNYHFGFDIGVQTIFHNRNTSLGFNWVHFKSNTCANHTIPVDSDMVGPFFEIGPDASAYSNAAGNVNFNFNTANLTYGQTISLGHCLQTTIFAGISFASIKECLTAGFSNADLTVTRTITTPTTFRGAGPQFGVNFCYNIIRDLYLTGQSTVAILAGRAQNFTGYVSTSPVLGLLGFPSPNEQSTQVCNRSIVVPGFEERIGLAYAWNYCDWLFSVEAGWDTYFYINAIQSVDMGSQVVDVDVIPETAGVFARTFQRNVSNFALTGAYFGFNVAF